MESALVDSHPEKLQISFDKIFTNVLMIKILYVSLKGKILLFLSKVFKNRII